MHTRCAIDSLDSDHSFESKRILQTLTHCTPRSFQGSLPLLNSALYSFSVPLHTAASTFADQKQSAIHPQCPAINTILRKRHPFPPLPILRASERNLRRRQARQSRSSFVETRCLRLGENDLTATPRSAPALPGRKEESVQTLGESLIGPTIPLKGDDSDEPLIPTRELANDLGTGTSRATATGVRGRKMDRRRSWPSRPRKVHLRTRTDSAV